MADHHERAFVGGERALQLADADQVEVVGRLVQEQELRRRLGVQDAGEGGPQALAARQHPDRKVNAGPRNRKRASRFIRCASGIPGANAARFSATVRSGSEVEPLGQVGDAAVGALDRGALRLDLAVHHRSRVDLPAPLGPVSAIRSGPGSSGRPRRRRTRPGGRGGPGCRSPRKTVRPAGTLVPGSSRAIVCSSRRARLASSSRALAVADPCGVRLSPCPPIPGRCASSCRRRSSAAPRCRGCGRRCWRAARPAPGPAASPASPA